MMCWSSIKNTFFPINVFYLHRRQIPQGCSALLQVTKSSFSDGRVVSSVLIPLAVTSAMWQPFKKVSYSGCLRRLSSS